MTVTTESRTEAEDFLDQITPATAVVKDGRHLRAIGAALNSLEAAEQQLREAVRAANAAGDSWEAIGMVLGTSRQAAHRKYAAS